MVSLPILGSRTPALRPGLAGPTGKKVYFVSLGCPKNQVDTEIMLGLVRANGHELVDAPELADMLVVNTCGFIEAAKEESIETILELARVKADGKPKQLVVAGCLSQRYPTELAAELPEVDHFLGSADMLGLERVLGGTAERMGVSELGRRSWLYDHSTPRQTYGVGHTNYVKIAEGCDRPCGFCIIPKLRGPQRSRPVFDIVEEVHALVEQGTREICLIAQDLTTYGTDFGERGLAPAKLEGLLDALGEIAGLRWIRLHYAYPSAVTDGLIDRIANHPKLANYLDVPIQHIDNDVLKKMRRGYGERQVRELVDKLRSQSSKIWLRTTMLVGHPGEDEAAYQRLYDFIAEGAIDHLGVFPWSREEGTTSALHPQRVGEELANERAAALMELQAGIRAEKFAALRGEVLEVLVDGLSDESELLLEGRHVGQAPEIDGKVILCDATPDQIGEFVRARVMKTTEHDLIATADLERGLEEFDDELLQPALD